jgi:homogentisate phytyltransferase/homogentisate geranylgeranyltransferase
MALSYWERTPKRAWSFPHTILLLLAVINSAQGFNYPTFTVNTSLNRCRLRFRENFAIKNIGLLKKVEIVNAIRRHESVNRVTKSLLFSFIERNGMEGNPRTAPTDQDPVSPALSAHAIASPSEEEPSFSGEGKYVTSLPFPVVLWRFTRPHTLIGSALAIPALHLLAAPSLESLASKHMLFSLLYSMIPALLMNVFITGLNQITDVEIDKINKPSLPIAAGDLSKRLATFIVIACLVGSLWLGSNPGRYATEGLAVALWGSAILGTLYSLPPFRLKRFPLMAAFCIVAVRGTIINAGFYAHAQAAAFGNAAATSLKCILNDKRCMLSSAFFCIFGIVIALMKDVPDAVGDELHEIRTFSVRVGRRRIFHTTRRLITALFFGVGVGFINSTLPAIQSNGLGVRDLCRGGVGVVSFIAGLTLRREGLKVDAEDSEAVYSYYMLLWKWFYLSYLALPFAR